ncbi:hypothetical protein PAXRUDRAFT_62493, partial [Paxillus rubicundulus Ve08.2h10]
VEVWKEAEKKWLERNNSCHQTYHDKLALWNTECAQAKVKKWQPGWARPKHGKLESPIPKLVADSAEGDKDNEDDDGNNKSDGRSMEE